MPSEEKHKTTIEVIWTFFT